jgi:hypothetical protein
MQQTVKRLPPVTARIPAKRYAFHSPRQTSRIPWPVMVLLSREKPRDEVRKPRGKRVASKRPPSWGTTG